MTKWLDATSAARLSPKDVGERIRNARQDRALSLAALGQLVGRSAPSIQQWEMGASEPGLEMLGQLAVKLNLNLLELITGLDARPGGTWKLIDDDFIPEDNDEEPDAEGASAVDLRPRSLQHLRGRRMDLFRDPSKLVAEILRKGPRKPSSSAIVSCYGCGTASFAVEIWDQRCFPQFAPGDTIVVDPERSPKPGDMVLVRTEDELAIGRLAVTNDGNAEILATNPDWPSIRLGAFETMRKAPSTKARAFKTTGPGGERAKFRIVGVLTEHTVPAGGQHRN